MIAIVCDRCGKAMPAPNFDGYTRPEGVNVLRYWGPEKNGYRPLEQVDLCGECTDVLLLLTGVREENEANE